MAKKTTRKVARKNSKIANPVLGYLAALQRVAGIVYAFAYVQNPPTQFVQREVSASVKITTSTRKTPVAVTLAEFLPAQRRDSKTGKVLEQNKRFARAMLTAFQIGKVSNPESETLNLAAYLAAKILTSRPRSLEGVLSTQCLREIESVAGIRVESVNDNGREVLESKMQELESYLTAGIENGFIAAVRGRRKLGRAVDLNL